MSHRGYTEKNRREISLYDRRVREILPDNFPLEYPKFIQFLETYYEYLESTDSPAELVDHLFESKDITETDEVLLGFMEDELLLGESYFQGFKDKRAAAKISSSLYKSKGSKLSIQQFFRTFYQQDPEIVYTKENIFKLNDSKIGPDSFRYITDDKLYQTYAILIKVGIPITDWKEIYKLFVHPAGFYLGGELQIISELGFGSYAQNDALGNAIPLVFDGYDLMDSAGPLDPIVPTLSTFAQSFSLGEDQAEAGFNVFDSDRTRIGEVKTDLDRFHQDQFDSSLSLQDISRFNSSLLRTVGGFVVNGVKPTYQPGGIPGVDYASAYVPSYPTFDVDALTGIPDSDQVLGHDIDFSADSSPTTNVFRGGLTTMDRQ